MDGTLRVAIIQRLGVTRRLASTVGVIFLPMQVTTGTVVGGQVVVEGVPLVEGAVVAVLSREAEAPFALSVEDEEELLAAMAEIAGGELVSAEDLLESLRKYG